MSLKARIENGQLVGDAPPGFPEGTVFKMSVGDAGDEMTAEQLEELNQALDAAWESMKAGRFRPAADVMAELRSKMR